MTDKSTIYWIGTGPGDPGLMTIKGMTLVQEAEAIVGDTLGNARLLQQAPSGVEIHNVGCRACENKLSLEAVNQLLLDLARRKKTIVRLWQGDPFVYGRAAQEMVAAGQAGIRVQLVPGVTSAIAAPAYAGVPVTHWEHATSFAVATGYESKNPDVRPDWDALAKMETLVILMPLDNLPEIVERLRSAGRAADTPALAVQQGTHPQQRQVLATLGTLVDAVKTHAIEHPAIVVVGSTAQLSAELNWFQPDEVPLLGKRVLVTRPLHQAADFMAELRNLGAEPVSFPTIEICPTEDTSALDKAITHVCCWTAGRLGGKAAEFDGVPFDWLVLTSVNGVNAFWRRINALGLDSRCLASVKIAAIGPATAETLQKFSVTPNLVPDVYTAEGMLDAFDQMGSVAGQRFLLARADIARKTLATGLAKRGALVDEIPAYRTVPVQAGPVPPAADIITFTSSSTVQGYVNCLKSSGYTPEETLKESQIVCIGPVTAATAHSLSVPVTRVAQEYTIAGLLKTIQGGIK